MVRTRSVHSAGAADSSSRTAGATQASEPTSEMGPPTMPRGASQGGPQATTTSSVPSIPEGFWERFLTAVAGRDPRDNPLGFNGEPSAATDDADPDDSSSLSSVSLSSDEDDSSDESSRDAGPSNRERPSRRRRAKLRKSRDLKVDFPEKYRSSYTFQQRDNWKAEMERVFEAAPYAY